MGLFITFHIECADGNNQTGNGEIDVDDFKGIDDVRRAETQLELELAVGAITIMSWKRFNT